MADRLPESGTLWNPLVGSSDTSTVRVEEEADEGITEAEDGGLVPERLDLESVFRKVGVRSDSLAFGSSSLVYRPIDGL